MTKTKSRISSTAEVFTPSWLVEEIMDKMPQFLFSENKTGLDRCCGNGQIIIGILKRKVSFGISKEDAISTTYGLDLMADNICDTIARVVFWLNWDVDIFDDKGNPVDGLELPSYDDHHTAYWLKKHNAHYKRTYKFNNHQVTVRNRKDKWWLMECRIDDNKDYNNRTLCNSFVVGDALYYNFNEFSEEPILKEEEVEIVEGLFEAEEKKSVELF